jgi:hypothetical protein
LFYLFKMEERSMTRILAKGLIAGLLVLLQGTLAFGQDAYIRDCTGTVELKAPGTAVWTPAKAGQPLTRDTVVSTGFKSSALIVIGNSTLTVRALTRLSLEELQNTRGSESVALGLETGRVRADVKPPAGGKIDFTVKSPSVTASVRGTSFDFDGINLNVGEGRVYVSGAGGTGTYVGAGHGSVFDTKTGRTSGPEETFKAGLVPAVPLGGGEGGQSAPIMPAIPAMPEPDPNLNLTITY